MARTRERVGDDAGVDARIRYALDDVGVDVSLLKGENADGLIPDANMHREIVPGYRRLHVVFLCVALGTATRLARLTPSDQAMAHVRLGEAMLWQADDAAASPSSRLC